MWKAIYLKCLLIAASLLATLSEASAQEIKILAQLPLTGPLASAGSAIKAGIELAVSSAGSDIKVIFEDNQYNPQLAVSSLKNTDSREKISALLIFGGPTSLAVRSYVENRKIPTIALSAANQLDHGGNGYIKRIWESAETMGRLIAIKAEELEAKRVAVITAENDSTLRIEQSILENLKIQPELQETVTLQETDFRSIATRMRTKKTDLLVSNVLAGQHALLASKLKEQSIHIPIIVQSSISFDPQFRAPYPDIFKGMYVATVDDSQANSLYLKLQDDERTANSVYMTALAYDAFNWISKSRQSGWDMLSPLNTQHYSGILGDYRQVTPDSLEPPMKLIHIQ